MLYGSFRWYKCWLKTVFLTHVGIRQMPTQLPTWKAKSLYHVGTFLPTWFILPLKNCRYFQIYVLHSLSSANCKQLRKRNCLYQSSLFVMLLSVDIRSNQFRVYYYYCSVLHKNRVPRMCEPLPFFKLIIP